jgi:hypothetical protein
VQAAFNALASAQRDAPENAKDEPHRLLGGGGVMLPWLTEHVGDLTHRMAEHGGRLGGGHSKVADALYWLRQPGSPRDFAAGLARDVERMAAHRGPGLRRALDAALAVYAAEHRKLRVYNQAQFAAREAAVALGEQRFADAVTMLEYLEALVKDGTWEAAVREYRLAPDGSVMAFPWASRRIEHVEVSGPGTPEHLRFDGLLRTVAGVRVVEVHKDWYFSPDLRVSANRQYKSEGAAENGWIVMDELHPHLGHSDHISTKPEALRLMVEWAARLSQETR